MTIKYEEFKNMGVENLENITQEHPNNYPCYELALAELYLDKQQNGKAYELLKRISNHDDHQDEIRATASHMHAKSLLNKGKNQTSAAIEMLEKNYIKFNHRPSLLELVNHFHKYQDPRQFIFFAITLTIKHSTQDEAKKAFRKLFRNAKFIVKNSIDKLDRHELYNVKKLTNKSNQIGALLLAQFGFIRLDWGKIEIYDLGYGNIISRINEHKNAELELISANNFNNRDTLLGLYQYAVKFPILKDKLRSACEKYKKLINKKNTDKYHTDEIQKIINILDKKSMEKSYEKALKLHEDGKLKAAFSTLNQFPVDKHKIINGYTELYNKINQEKVAAQEKINQQAQEQYNKAQEQYLDGNIAEAHAMLKKMDPKLLKIIDKQNLLKSVNEQHDIEENVKKIKQSLVAASSYSKEPKKIIQILFTTLPEHQKKCQISAVKETINNLLKTYKNHGFLYQYITSYHKKQLTNNYISKNTTSATAKRNRPITNIITLIEKNTDAETLKNKINRIFKQLLQEVPFWLRSDLKEGKLPENKYRRIQLIQKLLNDLKLLDKKFPEVGFVLLNKGASPKKTTTTTTTTIKNAKNVTIEEKVKIEERCANIQLQASQYILAPKKLINELQIVAKDETPLAKQFTDIFNNKNFMYNYTIVFYLQKLDKYVKRKKQKTDPNDLSQITTQKIEESFVRELQDINKQNEPLTKISKKIEKTISRRQPEQKSKTTQSANLFNSILTNFNHDLSMISTIKESKLVNENLYPELEEPNNGEKNISDSSLQTTLSNNTNGTFQPPPAYNPEAVKPEEEKSDDLFTSL